MKAVLLVLLSVAAIGAEKPEDFCPAHFWSVVGCYPGESECKQSNPRRNGACWHSDDRCNSIPNGILCYWPKGSNDPFYP